MKLFYNNYFGLKINNNFNIKILGILITIGNYINYNINSNINFSILNY